MKMRYELCSKAKRRKALKEEVQPACGQALGYDINRRGHLSVTAWGVTSCSSVYIDVDLICMFSLFYRDNLPS